VTWSNGDILATVSRSGVFIERAGLKLLDPGPDQVARNVVAFRETVERHAHNEFLGDLPFVFDAMGTVPGYGFPPLKARQSISNLQDVHRKGALHFADNSTPRQNVPMTAATMPAWCRGARDAPGDEVGESEFPFKPSNAQSSMGSWRRL
jgi:hypothetical protein